MIIVIYNENTKEFEVLPNRLNGINIFGSTTTARPSGFKDGVTDVIIPDSMLENDDATRNYDMFAFIYLTDATSGQTEYKIKLQVKSRPKPEAPGGGEDPNIFREAVQAVQRSADKAVESEKQAELIL